MNAVVLTVKASYIASTKYRNKSGNKEVKLILYCNREPIYLHILKPVVQWKMRLPEKKPLILVDRQSEFNSRAKKNTTKKRLEPLQVLSEFQN